MTLTQIQTPPLALMLVIFGKHSNVSGNVMNRMNSKGLTLKEKEDEILEEFLGVVRFCRYWMYDPTYFSVMKTVDKMLKSSKSLDFREALNCAIKERNF